MKRALAAPTLLIAAMGGALGCERMGLESLGTLRPEQPRVTAMAADAGSAQPMAAGNAPALGNVDAGMPLPAAGNPSPVTVGSAGAPGSGGAGVAGAAGAAGAAGMPGALTGNFGSTPFASVKAAYVVGNSDEFGFTTMYLIDSSVTCSQVSRLAWLNQLPASVQVIEVMFSRSAMAGSAAIDCLVSFAHGGMYSFTKSGSSMRVLMLSQYMQGGAVDGTLDATFPSGSVSGAFHASYCASGVSF